MVYGIPAGAPEAVGQQQRPTSTEAVVVEPTGAEIRIMRTLAGEEVCAVTQDRLQLDPGDEVRLMPLLDHIICSTGQLARSHAMRGS